MGEEGWIREPRRFYLERTIVFEFIHVTKTRRYRIKERQFAQEFV